MEQKIFNRFFKRWIKNKEIEDSPKTIQEVFLQRAHYFFLKELNHGAFLRKAPKHYNFRGNRG